MPGEKKRLPLKRRSRLVQLQEELEELLEDCCVSVLSSMELLSNTSLQEDEGT
jgi:hypothetical protein